MTDNFSRSEFACTGSGCCEASAPINPALVHTLQDFRNYLAAHCETPQITITSGFRCNVRNRAVGGVVGSQHTLGMAADCAFRIPYAEAVRLFLDWYAECEPPALIGRGGVGIYPDNHFIHFDVRIDEEARWGKTNADGYIELYEAVQLVLGDKP